MKEPKKTYVGMAVFFDRLADDGWPEDAGWWPKGGAILTSVKSSRERIQGFTRLSPSQFIKSLLWNRNRK